MRVRSRREAALAGEDHRLDAVAGADLHQDVPDERLDGRLGEDEGRGEVGVGTAVGDQRQDLALACGELAEGGRQLRPGRRAADEGFDDRARDGRRQQYVAARDGVDRGQQVFGCRVLEREPARAGPQRLEEIRVVAAPDVVLMDIRMPGVDGIEATRRIVAASDGAIRVLMLTTASSDSGPPGATDRRVSLCERW
jgi:CheY-like chemotaxis protein